MEWPWKKTRSKPFRRYICGEDSLRIAADEPYCLHRPMCRGRLNVSTHYSLQQVFQSSRTMGSILLICSSGSFFQLVWMPCRLSVVCSIFGNDCHMVFSPGEMVCCRNMHLPEPRYQLSSPVLNWVWGNIIDVIVGSILLWVGRLSHTVLHGQVCDDVYKIWDWILTEKFNLAAKSRRNLSAVIVVPDTLDNRGANPLSKDASLFLLFNYDVSFLLQF